MSLNRIAHHYRISLNANQNEAMMLRTLFFRSFLFCLICLGSPLTSLAQSFIATPVQHQGDAIQNASTKAFSIDTDAIYAYANQQSGTFPLTLSFQASQHWEMELAPHDLRSPSYRLITADGLVHSDASSPAITYKGTLRGQPNSEVRMTITNGYLRALIQEDEALFYYIESTDTGSLKANPTVLLSQGDPYNFDGMCATSHEHAIHQISNKKGASNSEAFNISSLAPYETEIAFVVDRLGFEQFASLDDLELELLTVLNYTDAYYAIHGLTYRLTETFVSTDLENQPWPESNDAGEMLNEFTDWANENGSLLHNDVATLWTGISFGSTIGIAWVHTLGGSHSKNVVNFPIGRDRRNASVHAHELGHNWGSSHVGSSGWIMSAALSNADAEKEWHTETISAFPSYIEDAIQHLDDLEGNGGVLQVGIGDIAVTEEINNNELLDPGETANLVVEIENLEDIAIENVVVTMSNDNNRAKNNVTINSDAFKINKIDPNTSALVSFNVTLSVDAPVSKSLRFMYEISDGSKTSALTASIFSGDASLPVDLVSFEAVGIADGAALVWETASEFNNAGFEIELQYNERPFEQVAFVQGAGTTLAAQQYRHDLSNLQPGQYGFRLKQVDFDGKFEYSDVVYLDLLPQAYSLKQNYPNPFNPQTRIEFLLPVAKQVTLEVFDALGRRVAVLLDASLEAGQHDVVFDGNNLPNGIYLYRLKAGEYSEMKTMMLMK